MVQERQIEQATHLVLVPHSKEANERKKPQKEKIQALVRLSKLLPWKKKVLCMQEPGIITQLPKVEQASTTAQMEVPERRAKQKVVELRMKWKAHLEESRRNNSPPSLEMLIRLKRAEEAAKGREITEISDPLPIAFLAERRELAGHAGAGQLSPKDTEIVQRAEQEVEQLQKKDQKGVESHIHRVDDGTAILAQGIRQQGIEDEHAGNGNAYDKHGQSLFDKIFRKAGTVTNRGRMGVGVSTSAATYLTLGASHFGFMGVAGYASIAATAGHIAMPIVVIPAAIFRGVNTAYKNVEADAMLDQLLVQNNTAVIPETNWKGYQQKIADTWHAQVKWYLMPVKGLAILMSFVPYLTEGRATEARTNAKVTAVRASGESLLEGSGQFTRLRQSNINFSDVHAFSWKNNHLIRVNNRLGMNKAIEEGKAGNNLQQVVAELADVKYRMSDYEGKYLQGKKARSIDSMIRKGVSADILRVLWEKTHELQQVVDDQITAGNISQEEVSAINEAVKRTLLQQRIVKNLAMSGLRTSRVVRNMAVSLVGVLGIAGITKLSLDAGHIDLSNTSLVQGLQSGAHLLTGKDATAYAAAYDMQHANLSAQTPDSGGNSNMTIIDHHDGTYTLQQWTVGVGNKPSVARDWIFKSKDGQNYQIYRSDYKIDPRHAGPVIRNGQEVQITKNEITALLKKPGNAADTILKDKTLHDSIQSLDKDMAIYSGESYYSPELHTVLVSPDPNYHFLSEGGKTFLVDNTGQRVAELSFQHPGDITSNIQVIGVNGANYGNLTISDGYASIQVNEFANQYATDITPTGTPNVSGSHFALRGDAEQIQMDSTLHNAVISAIREHGGQGFYQLNLPNGNHIYIPMDKNGSLSFVGKPPYDVQIYTSHGIEHITGKQAQEWLRTYGFQAVVSHVDSNDSILDATQISGVREWDFGGSRDVAVNAVDVRTGDIKHIIEQIKKNPGSSGKGSGEGPGTGGGSPPGSDGIANIQHWIDQHVFGSRIEGNVQLEVLEDAMPLLALGVVAGAAILIWRRNGPPHPGVPPVRIPRGLRGQIAAEHGVTDRDEIRRLADVRLGFGALGENYAWDALATAMGIATITNRVSLERALEHAGVRGNAIAEVIVRAGGAGATPEQIAAELKRMIPPAGNVILITPEQIRIARQPAGNRNEWNRFAAELGIPYDQFANAMTAVDNYMQNHTRNGSVYIHFEEAAADIVKTFTLPGTMTSDQIQRFQEAIAARLWNSADIVRTRDFIKMAGAVRQEYINSAGLGNTPGRLDQITRQVLPVAGVANAVPTEAQALAIARALRYGLARQYGVPENQLQESILRIAPGLSHNARAVVAADLALVQRLPVNFDMLAPAQQQQLVNSQRQQRIYHAFTTAFPAGPPSSAEFLAVARALANNFGDNGQLGNRTYPVSRNIVNTLHGRLNAPVPVVARVAAELLPADNFEGRVVNALGSIPQGNALITQQQWGGVAEELVDITGADRNIILQNMRADPRITQSGVLRTHLAGLITDGNGEAKMSAALHEIYESMGRRNNAYINVSVIGVVSPNYIAQLIFEAYSQGAQGTPPIDRQQVQRLMAGHPRLQSNDQAAIIAKEFTTRYIAANPTATQDQIVDISTAIGGIPDEAATNQNITSDQAQRVHAVIDELSTSGVLPQEHIATQINRLHFGINAKKQLALAAMRDQFHPGVTGSDLLHPALIYSGINSNTPIGEVREIVETAQTTIQAAPPAGPGLLLAVTEIDAQLRHANINVGLESRAAVWAELVTPPMGSTKAQAAVAGIVAATPPANAEEIVKIAEGIYASGNAGGGNKDLISAMRAVPNRGVISAPEDLGRVAFTELTGRHMPPDDAAKLAIAIAAPERTSPPPRLPGEEIYVVVHELLSAGANETPVQEAMHQITGAYTPDERKEIAVFATWKGIDALAPGTPGNQSAAGLVQDQIEKVIHEAVAAAGGFSGTLPAAERTAVKDAIIHQFITKGIPGGDPRITNITAALRAVGLG